MNELPAKAFCKAEGASREFAVGVSPYGKIGGPDLGGEASSRAQSNYCFGGHSGPSEATHVGPLSARSEHSSTCRHNIAKRGEATVVRRFWRRGPFLSR